MPLYYEQVGRRRNESARQCHGTSGRDVAGWIQGGGGGGHRDEGVGVGMSMAVAKLACSASGDLRVAASWRLRAGLGWAGVVWRQTYGTWSKTTHARVAYIRILSLFLFI